MHFTADPKRDVGQKQGQPYSDEQVATYDCIERLKGYNYVAVIDVDEYIYARNAKDHNLKAFLVCAQHFFSYFLCCFKYSRTSVARATLGLLKFIRDKGSSSH